jgi:hypothetical protein
METQMGTAPSFALGSDAQYTLMQARVLGTTHNAATLNIQGGGPAGNRDYGVAVQVQVSKSLADWLSGQWHLLKSLADSKAKYAYVQARYDPDLKGVRFQVSGGPEYNRPYGAAFVISEAAPDIEPLVQWLQGKTEPETTVKITVNPSASEEEIKANIKDSFTLAVPVDLLPVPASAPKPQKGPNGKYLCAFCGGYHKEKPG